MDRAKDSTPYQKIRTSDLLFDPENPRLIEHTDGKDPGQDELLRILWQEMAVDELAMSIEASGFFAHEPLFVIPHGDKWIVIEGNRRLAAVRLLLGESDRKRLHATDLPKAAAKLKKDLEALPAVITTRKKAWQYLGFKHVNGPAKWDSYPKAQYIAEVHNIYGIPLGSV